MSRPKVSVVIPTYNRPESVLRTLDSLCRQTLPFAEFEVVVVDDGSNYEAARVAKRPFPFSFRFIRQPNQGATIARNNGVSQTSGEVLVFIDDDVTISPEALAVLAEACLTHERIIAMGTLISRSDSDAPSPFTRDALALANARYAGNGRYTDEFVPFVECNTQLLAVRREDFMALGMLQDPTGGWPNWDDVDFGYRAHLAGFRLLRCGQAVGEHWDYSLADLQKACLRWQRAGKSAVRLFQVHPGLRPHIPMFADKTPVTWGEDPPRLVIRKLVRQVSATPLVVWSMEQIVRVLERVYPSPGLLRPFYRWIQGNYMYRGYREGLRVYHTGEIE
ncbi:MAG: glycosyltransferase family 2 protein [Chloroflexi bacterium]|nr:MAG: glycosyltransferase family 2 protein [Chloroflexota bacterium]